MTKVTVFGQEEKKEEKKVIKLCHFMDIINMSITVTSDKASMYDEVCLLGKAYEEYDIVMCWDIEADHKEIYLGHWNDGVVD